MGDGWAKHCCDDCHKGTTASGSGVVLINGRQAARVGDSVDCGSYIMTGSRKCSYRLTDMLLNKNRNTITAFSDFDVNFVPHPLTGDVPKKTNIEAIKQALLNLFYLDKYDVPFDMDCYSNLRKSLFELTTGITALNIQSRLEWLIKKYEPRVHLLDLTVAVYPSEDGYQIYARYRIKDLNVEDNIRYVFTRIR